MTEPIKNLSDYPYRIILDYNASSDIDKLMEFISIYQNFLKENGFVDVVHDNAFGRLLYGINEDYVIMDMGMPNNEGFPDKLMVCSTDPRYLMMFRLSIPSRFTVLE